jgi:hypothetical protein
MGRSGALYVAEDGASARTSGRSRGRTDLRVLIFQGIRELLFNVRKHAGVHRARVTLTQDGTYLVTSVIDEGAGSRRRDWKLAMPMPKEASVYAAFENECGWSAVIYLWRPRPDKAHALRCRCQLAFPNMRTPSRRR